MAKVIQVADDFWNIRGEFKIGGLLDIGTHASLVRRDDGTFILLDACGFDDATQREILAITDGGNAVSHVVHLHPFHTVSCATAHKLFPEARLHGTARHKEVHQDLPWHAVSAEDLALHAELAETFEFFIPQGVDFISANSNVHFASVMALHKRSQTLHVDDTLNFTKLPFIGGLRFHPTLGKALQPRAGAAAEFRQWATALATRCADLQTLCAAHSWLTRRSDVDVAFDARLRDALKTAESTLAKHEKKYG